jgi:hypothetical protein
MAVIPNGWGARKRCLAVSDDLFDADDSILHIEYLLVA